MSLLERALLDSHAGVRQQTVRLSERLLLPNSSMTDAVLKLVDGKIRLRLLVDRTSVDIFGNDGALYMPMGMIIPADKTALELYVNGGAAQKCRLELE